MWRLLKYLRYNHFITNTAWNNPISENICDFRRCSGLLGTRIRVRHIHYKLLNNLTVYHCYYTTIISLWILIRRCGEMYDGKLEKAYLASTILRGLNTYAFWGPAGGCSLGPCRGRSSCCSCLIQSGLVAWFPCFQESDPVCQLQAESSCSRHGPLYENTQSSVVDLGDLALDQ